MAIAVPAGSSRPDIGSEEALKAAAPGAATKGHPTGPSGTQLPRAFERWGILDKIRERIVQALAGVPVAHLIAKGDVALGFQQLSELLGVTGIEIVGPLPDAAQTITVFSGAVCSAASAPETARSWLGFMASQAVNTVQRVPHGTRPACADQAVTIQPSTGSTSRETPCPGCAAAQAACARHNTASKRSPEASSTNSSR